MHELRIKVPTETLSRFDETKADLVRYLGRRQSSREALDVLIFVCQSVRKEGRLGTVLSKYQGAAIGVELH